MNYYVFNPDTNKEKIHCVYIFDVSKQLIFKLEAGNRSDTTKECKRLYDAQERKKDWYNATQGAKWYRALINNDIESITGYKQEIIFKTDDYMEVSNFLYDIQMKQIENLINVGIGYYYK